MVAKQAPGATAPDSSLYVTITDGAGNLGGATGGSVTVANAAGASAVNVQDGGNSLTVDGTVTSNAGTGTFTTKETRSATGTQSNVAGSATDVTILAANANRLGATVYNDSTAVLYLLVGAGTSSATVHSVQLAAGSYYEVPYGYTGILKGLWASATGSARVTELT